MRWTFFAILLASLVACVFAWEKEDYEIFDLVSAIEKAEGPGTTFYSWLDVSPTATSTEIAKAYRKKSVTMHPDRNPGVKNIQERFARLGVVSTILRSPEGRTRYDFFYKNGVPKWRGTGYYYSRFRPGLGTVCVFLTLLTAGLQYVVQRMNYNRDVGRINMFIRRARLSAWGPKMVPLEGKRKVKVHLAGNQDVEGEEQVAVTGRTVDMIVEGDKVYLLDPSGEMHPLDESTPSKPALTRTWPIALARALVGKLTGAKEPVEAVDTDEESTEVEETGDEASSAAEGKPKISGAAKAGGRRRKQVKRH